LKSVGACDSESKKKLRFDLEDLIVNECEKLSSLMKGFYNYITLGQIFSDKIKYSNTEQSNNHNVRKSIVSFERELGTKSVINFEKELLNRVQSEKTLKESSSSSIDNKNEDIWPLDNLCVLYDLYAAINFSTSTTTDIKINQNEIPEIDQKELKIDELSIKIQNYQLEIEWLKNEMFEKNRYIDDLNRNVRQTMKFGQDIKNSIQSSNCKTRYDLLW
jgi:hypothetical protein